MNTIPSISRRDAMRRVIGFSVALSALDMPVFAQGGTKTIGSDPNLLAHEIPWPTVLTEAEMRVVAALGDIILPADDLGPAASALGVPEFVNEWVSAPYEEQAADLAVIRPGLALLDAEATRRFGQPFADIAGGEAKSILDAIVAPGGELREAGHPFFTTFRNLATGGYFSTPEGWKTIGYVGNVAMAEFPGPPPEVLEHLGLA